MEQLLLILLIIEIVLFVVIDRMLFGTFVTPIIALSIPYLFVVLMAIFIGPKLGFVKFYYPSLWIWIIGLPLFWFPGFILAIFFLKKTNIYCYPYSINYNVKLEDLVYKISIFIIIILFFGFIKSLGAYRIATEEFGNVFGTGISGHFMLLSKLFYVYLIILYKKKYIIPILILTIFYLSYGSKTWIFLPFFAAILSRIILKKTTLKLSLIVKLLMVGMILFYTIYRLALGSYADFSFVYLHFFKYVFSGVLGLSEYTLNSGPIALEPSLLINPLVNIFNKITHSDLQSLVSNISTNIGLNCSPNVKTFFGTIFIYGGVGWSIFFCLLFGFFSYVFLIIVIISKELLYLIVYALFLASLLFGWFDIHFNNLFFYELPVFSILFVSLYPYLISQKRSIN